MKNTFKRSGAALISLVLLLVLAVSAGAASSQNVGVKFWKERSDKESMANSGIDSDRTATLTRQANGTYTLTLPVMQVSKLGVTGYLSGLPFPMLYSRTNPTSSNCRNVSSFSPFPDTDL